MVRRCRVPASVQECGATELRACRFGFIGISSIRKRSVCVRGLGVLCVGAVSQSRERRGGLITERCERVEGIRGCGVVEECRRRSVFA